MFEAPSADPRLEGEPEFGAEEFHRPIADDLPVLARLPDEDRADLEHLIGMATSGRLPIERELKYWEPNKLNARHIQIIMMKASGLSQNLIAEIADVSPANVSVVLNHPYARLLLNRILSYAAEKATDIPARIKAHAGEALDTALTYMRTGDERTASRNAFKLLEMAGYGAVEKKAVVHSVVVPPEHAALLTSAIRESNDITDLVTVTQEPPAPAEPTALGPGSASSGAASAGQPPPSGFQAQPAATPLEETG